MKTIPLSILCVVATAGCADEKSAMRDETSARLPAFSLESVAGERFSLRYDGEALGLARPDGSGPVRGVLIHFFQPDCNACIEEMKALDALHDEVAGRDMAILGIAHRRSPEEAREIVRKLELSYPVLLGQESDVANAFARGDATVIADSKGAVCYTQVGFQPKDVATWRKNLEQLLAGEDVATHESGRERLAKGDAFPAVRLPGLRDGKAMALAVEAGRLTLIDETGTKSHPKAAVGFFSRYWDFSVEEMGHLQALHEKYGAQGLAVFAINMLENLDQARTLTKEHGWTYPIFNGVGSKLGRRYAYGWPAYILDAGGVVRYTQVGFEAGDEAKYEEIIRDILGK